MISLFDELSLPQHQDAISGLHGGQTVGNHNRRALLQQAIEITLQGGLRGRIHEGGGFIHHQHGRITDGHPCHGKQLSLS